MPKYSVLKNKTNSDFSKFVLFPFGGERGIRTLGTFIGYTRFPIVRLRPAQPSLQKFVYAIESLTIIHERKFFCNCFWGDFQKIFCFIKIILLPQEKSKGRGGKERAVPAKKYALRKSVIGERQKYSAQKSVLRGKALKNDIVAFAL